MPSSKDWKIKGLSPRGPSPVLMTVLCYFLLSSPLFALQIPSRPEGYVSDYAQMLSPSTRASLEEKLRRFEEETSNQVVVVTFPSLEGEVLEDFSIRLAEKWKIGQKGKDNGVILLIFKNDRKARIEVGYGLEGALPDATCKLIIENEIVPRFRQGKFDEGIKKAVEATLAATKGESVSEPRQKADENVWDIVKILLLLSFLALVHPVILLILAGTSTLLGLWAAIFLHEMLLSMGCLGLASFLVWVFFFLRVVFPGKMVMSRDGSVWRQGGYWGGGLGGGGFGGGGFSGGGGSFGGGGASGRW